MSRLCLPSKNSNIKWTKNLILYFEYLPTNWITLIKVLLLQPTWFLSTSKLNESHFQKSFNQCHTVLYIRVVYKANLLPGDFGWSQHLLCVFVCQSLSRLMPSHCQPGLWRTTCKYNNVCKWEDNLKLLHISHT